MDISQELKNVDYMLGLSGVYDVANYVANIRTAYDAKHAECLDLLGSMADGWPHEGDAGAMDALAGILGVKLVEGSGRMRMDPATLPEGYADPYVNDVARTERVSAGDPWPGDDLVGGS